MPGWNFASVWDGIAAIVPDRDAIVCGARRVTWGEFSERSARLAWHLKTAGRLEPGDKVAIDLTNRPEYLETFYAALKLGCVPVNVNFRYQANEVEYLLDNSDAKVVVHGPEFADVVNTAAMQLDAGRDARCASKRAQPTSARSRERHRRRNGTRALPTATTSSSSTPAAPPACPRA